MTSKPAPAMVAGMDRSDQRTLADVLRRYAERGLACGVPLGPMVDSLYQVADELERNGSADFAAACRELARWLVN